MSDTPNGPGWWQASDHKWYPPEQHPDAPPPPTTQQNAGRPAGLVSLVAAGSLLLVAVVGLALLGAGGRSDDADSAAGTPSGRTLPVSNAERCSDQDELGCDTPAPIGTTFVDEGDGWTITYAASDVRVEPNPTPGCDTDPRCLDLVMHVAVDLDFTNRTGETVDLVELRDSMPVDHLPTVRLASRPRPMACDQLSNDLLEPLAPGETARVTSECATTIVPEQVDDVVTAVFGWISESAAGALLLQVQ